jgi:hypothetical protein
MTDLTLSIDGSRTVDATDLTDLNSALEALTQAHESGDSVAVRSGSLRWRDGGVWIQVSLTLPTTASNIETDKDKLAQVAVDTGLVSDIETAMEAVNVA